MEYFTLNDVALMTGFSSRSLRSYLSQGLLKGELIQRKWCFTVEDIENFLNQPFIKEGQRIKFRAFVINILDDVDQTNSTLLLHELKGNMEEVDKQIQSLLAALSVINTPFQMKYYYDCKHSVGKVVICADLEVLKELLNKW